MINDIMTYSIDLRKRVVGFVNEGGSKAKASRGFEVSLCGASTTGVSGKTSHPRFMVREIAK